MIESKFFRLWLSALLSILGLLLLTGAGQADTYWYATADSAGWTPQSLHVDFNTEMGGAVEQPVALGRITLNNCLLVNSTTLARPSAAPINLRQTLTVDLPAALADSLLTTPLTGTSPAEGVVKAIAEYLVQAGTFEALAVKKTGASGTSTVATYP